MSSASDKVIISVLCWFKSTTSYGEYIFLLNMPKTASYLWVLLFKSTTSYGEYIFLLNMPKTAFYLWIAKIEEQVL